MPELLGGAELLGDGGQFAKVLPDVLTAKVGTKTCPLVTVGKA
jgi:hypothetical protein